MNLSHKRIAEIRTLVSAGIQLGRTEAEDLLGHNDHLTELCEARARLVLRAESESETLRGLYQMHKQTETREMRDLKAENERLKTGYEAYERVNAELRDESEKLRKAASRYEWLRAETYGCPNIQVSEWIGPHECRLFGEELDQAIDQQLSKEASHD